MDYIREIAASSIFELAATGIPNGGSQNVWITSIADLGNGQTAFSGYTKGYLNGQDFQYINTYSVESEISNGKKFIGILQEENQIKWLKYIDEHIWSGLGGYKYKDAFVEKASDSSFYVLGNRSVYAEDLIANTYLAKFDTSGNELWRINNHGSNLIEANAQSASAVSLVVSEDDTVLTVESSKNQKFKRCP